MRSINARENPVRKGCASNERRHRSCRDQEWCREGEHPQRGHGEAELGQSKPGSPEQQGDVAVCILHPVKVLQQFSAQPRREMPGSSSNVLPVFAAVAKSNLTLKYFNREKVQRPLFKKDLPRVTRLLFRVCGVENSWWHLQMQVGAQCGRSWGGGGRQHGGSDPAGRGPCEAAL